MSPKGRNPKEKETLFDIKREEPKHKLIVMLGLHIVHLCFAKPDFFHEHL